MVPISQRAPDIRRALFFGTRPFADRSVRAPLRIPAMVSDALKSNSRQALDTARFQVRLTEVPKRGGGTRTYGFLSTADAVVIVPVLPDGRVVLIRNRRIACEQVLWEVPAGTMEAGEDPAECALREVEEETGYKAQKVTPIHGFFGCPGMVSEFLHAYVAEGLEKTAQNLDDTEEIEVHPMPLEQALGMIKDGTLKDAKSIASLLYYAMFMKGAE